MPPKPWETRSSKPFKHSEPIATDVTNLIKAANAPAEDIKTLPPTMI